MQPPTYQTALTLDELLTGADSTDGMTNTDLWRLGLGDTFDEMVKDGVTPLAIARAGLAAITDHQRGRGAAELIWENGLDPEALAAATTTHDEPTKKHKASRTRRG